MSRRIVTRASIPRRGNDTLIVINLPVLDNNPMAQPAARSFVQADAVTIRSPRIGIPFFIVHCRRVARLQILNEFVEEEFINFCRKLCVECAASGTSYHCGQPCFCGNAQNFAYGGDLIQHHFFSPSRSAEQTFLRFRVDDDVMSQRTNFKVCRAI